MFTNISVLKFLFKNQMIYRSFSELNKNKFNIKMTENCAKVDLE